MPKVSASIVTYNGYEEAACAVGSILSHTVGSELELYLVDNASPDGTGAKLESTDFGGNVDVNLLKGNVGFGSGHNSVIYKLKSDYHAVINPDITLCSDALTDICKYMDAHTDVAMVMPQLLFPNGDIQYTAKRKPTFMALLSRQLPLPFLKNIERRYLMQDKDLTCPQEIEFCSGCFFVIRTEIFRKIGGFDEKYFMYVEDADITQKALAYGKCMYLPSVSVHHSWHRDANKKLANFIMQIKSMFRYWSKWGFKFI
ncbi:MAG: glycosyltransferase family 2 protein [Oscillospiraceae bacterium]